MYKISDAAKRADLTVKTVRYYADIGLVEPAGRSGSGYRLYAEPDIAKLGFVGRARRYRFSIDQCRDLLSLYEDDQRPSAEVKRITLEKIAEIDWKLAELQALRDECDFCEMNLDEFYANKRYTKKAVQLVEQFIDFLVLNKRFVVNYLLHLNSATERQEKLHTTLKKIYDFEHLYFGQACDN